MSCYTTDKCDLFGLQELSKVPAACSNCSPKLVKHAVKNLYHAACLFLLNQTDSNELIFKKRDQFVKFLVIFLGNSCASPGLNPKMSQT